jgi:chloramphenicol O-acetyltransferase type A
MSFNYIDIENWSRKEWFEHYLNEVRCTYSITINIDITRLQIVRKEEKIKLYPVLIYLLSVVVNKYEEFRIDYDEYTEQGRLGYWDSVHPVYTVFHKDSGTFSSLWTEHDNCFSVFYDRYQKDIAKYGSVERFSPKENVPKNIFSVSSIPWTTFTGFNLNVYTDGSYLRPIFTFGKYF